MLTDFPPAHTIVQEQCGSALYLEDIGCLNIFFDTCLDGWIVEARIERVGIELDLLSEKRKTI